MAATAFLSGTAADIEGWLRDYRVSYGSAEIRLQRKFSSSFAAAGMGRPLYSEQRLLGR